MPDYSGRTRSHIILAANALCVSKLTQNLNQCWLIVYQAIRNVFCRNFIWNSDVFISTLRLRQNERHFADDTFKCIFLNENVWIPITIWLEFVPKGPIHNISSLVQIMAWRHPGDKPLSESIMVSLSMHICVTRPQWAKENAFENAICKMTTI